MTDDNAIDYVLDESEMGALILDRIDSGNRSKGVPGVPDGLPEMLASLRGFRDLAEAVEWAQANPEAPHVERRFHWDPAAVAQILALHRPPRGA
jgi:hypothetical protein